MTTKRTINSKILGPLIIEVPCCNGDQNAIITAKGRYYHSTFYMAESSMPHGIPLPVVSDANGFWDDLYTQVQILDQVFKHHNNYVANITNVSIEVTKRHISQFNRMTDCDMENNIDITLILFSSIYDIDNCLENLRCHIKSIITDRYREYISYQDIFGNIRKL